MGVLLSLFFVILVSGVCLSIYYTCLLLCLFLVCWVCENFSGGPGRRFSVWDSAVLSAGPVQFYLGTILKWMAGLHRFFFFFFFVVVGAVRLKWWGGGPSFLLFSLLYCQLLWRAVVCGRAPFFYIDFLLGYILIRFAVSYFISC